MNIHDYSSMFQPSPSTSSQIPLVIHHPSSWKTLPQPYHNHATGDYNHLPAPPFSPHPSHGGLLKRVVDGLQFHVSQQGPDPSRIETETNKTAAQEMVDAKALAASKSHSEAERRRRERINNHLTKLRSLLPNTTKTDKATLLAEVIQHVKDLKRQTSMIHEQSSVPSETDEFTIDNTSDEEGRIVIRASLCCEDRSDLLKDLMDTLKMLRLKTLKAEITTLGRRVKNVLFVTGDSSTCDNQQMANHSINIIEETLKALIEKTRDRDDSSLASIKRQRTNNVDRRKYC